MSTPTSNLTSYAQVTDLLSYRDWRQIADWISTTDTRGTQAELLSDPIVAQSLLSASGEVESFAFKGGKYTPADLSSLIGASQQYLIKLVCVLAIESLASRKARDLVPDSIPGVKWAREKLAQLGRGEAIFGFLETQDAGVVGVTPTWSDTTQQVSVQAQPFFGPRD